MGALDFHMNFPRDDFLFIYIYIGKIKIEYTKKEGYPKGVLKHIGSIQCSPKGRTKRKEGLQKTSPTIT